MVPTAGPLSGTPATAGATPVSGPRAPMVDGRGRVARKLRISLTDRCNFACLF